MNYVILKQLCTLDASFDPSLNSNDRLDMLITACLDLGIATRADIRMYLAALGRNPNRVVIRLNKGTGSNPLRHRWGQTETGLYFEHPGQSAAS